jgi:hypothetical protein
VEVAMAVVEVAVADVEVPVPVVEVASGITTDSHVKCI